MALDINAIKAKLNKLQNKNSKSNNLWKPSEGKQTIRILPYRENRENPFVELFFHYDFNGKTVVSPRSFGDPDPIYEFAMNLRKDGSRESYLQSKRFEPKMRTHVPILVRGEESEGVKYWAFGKLVYEQLLGYIADPDYGDITDIKTGRDIVVEFEKPETGYPKTTIRVKPNQTLAYDDPAKLKQMIEEQVPLSEIYEPKSYSELEKELTKYLDVDGDGSDVLEGSDMPAPEADSQKSEPVKVEKKVAAVVSDDVESAFDDLFNS